MALVETFNSVSGKESTAMSVHSMPDAFAPAECERIIEALSPVSARDALLVGQTRDHNLRNPDLVWMEDVDGMEWVMERLIELARRSNTDGFDFDLNEFAEGPLAACKLTLACQSNGPSNYDGGDLEVMPGSQVLSANRVQGCVSVFPSFSLHQETPVKGRRRYLITVWTHGRAFRQRGRS